MNGDEGWVERLRRGDRGALEEIVAVYGERLFNFILRLIGDRAAAEDVCQEVFMKVYRAGDKLRQPQVFQSWLYTVARNLSISHLRRRRSESRRPTPQPRLAEGPEEATAQAELERVVEEAIERIPEPFRSALLLCQTEKLSYEEAARVQGCSLKTFSSRLHRAREKFRELVRPYLFGVRA
jgi:RNA polymerase sigma-70 factor (ECF subfamily)